MTLNEVRSLLKWIKSFEFVVFTTFWYKTLTAVNNASLLLQSRSINLDDEMKIIQGLIEDLRRIRSSWNAILDESKLVAANLGFETDFVEKRRRRTKTFPDEPNNTAHHHNDASKAFEVDVFYNGLDTFIQQITERFQALKQQCGLFSFIWSTPDANSDSTIAQESKVKDLVLLYPHDLSEDEFIDEFRHFSSVRRHLLTSDRPLDLLNSIYAKGFEGNFPHICICLGIFLTLPVSVAEGERSFSKLALIKNSLRATMGQDRLNDCHSFYRKRSGEESELRCCHFQLCC